MIFIITQSFAINLKKFTPPFSEPANWSGGWLHNYLTKATKPRNM